MQNLSASVTRILSLTGFPKELKTKDIQAAFAEWDSVNGGFKIKWRDDTSLLIVFQDPAVAKRAYLHTIAFPPPTLTSSTTIRPYDGPDAQQVIQTVNTRGQHNSNPSRSHNARASSISVFPSRNGSMNGFKPGANVTIPEHMNAGREPSPTLPTLPSHPTLNSLINSSLGDAVTSDGQSQPDVSVLPTEGLGGPRIGNPGKRMLGAALGVRHPSLGPRVFNAGANGEAESAPMRDIQRSMGGLTVAE